MRAERRERERWRKEDKRKEVEGGERRKRRTGVEKRIGVDREGREKVVREKWEVGGKKEAEGMV